MSARLRLIILLLAFGLGGLFSQQIAPLRSLVPWSIGLMLLLTYLGIEKEQIAPKRAHTKLLIANALSATFFVSIALLMQWPALAEGLFYCAAAPIATAAPVIIGILGAQVGFMTTAMLLSHLIFALSTPFILPLLVQSEGQAHWQLTLGLLQEMALILLLPALLALGLRALFSQSKSWSKKIAPYSIYLWMLNILIITAAGVKNIASMQVQAHDMLLMAGVALLVCTINFTLGSWLGKPQLSQEYAQGMGQKNTILSLFIASQSFGSPLAYIAPAFYVFFHNIASSVQISRAKRNSP